jgi:hypothetical protein
MRNTKDEGTKTVFSEAIEAMARARESGGGSN